MSLLTIVQDAADLVGVQRPSTTATSDLTTRQLMTLSQQEGDELARRHDWRGLVIPAQMTGDGTSTDFDLPPDFHRLAAGPALWRNQTLVAPLAGPATSAEWVALTNTLTAGFRYAYRLLAGVIQVWPAPSAGEVLRLEYLSSHWISVADRSARRLRWSADSDFALVPERLVTLGLIWRWKRQKGLAYDEEKNTYEIELARACAADRGAREITAGRTSDDELAPLIVPDTITVP